MYPYIKRFLDFTLSLLLFTALLPLFGFLCVLVRWRLGKPVFFVQERTGMHGKTFYMRKFRTMSEARDEDGKYLPDEMRLGKLGRFLRSTSLDELPELLNIVSGKMSVIGPRPLPPSYDVYYTEREKQRFAVRGGLLPPDVAKSKSIITWDEQLEIEAQYGERLTFCGDVRIFFSAFKVLFERNGTGYGAYVRKTLPAERQNVTVAEKSQIHSEVQKEAEHD